LLFGRAAVRRQTVAEAIAGLLEVLEK